MAARFETELPVMPRDVDVNSHVHHSVYLDYLLAARFDQMERCYGMSMQAFWERGMTWVTRSYEIEYKTGIRLGDRVRVVTWVEGREKFGVTVGFEIESVKTGKTAARGKARYILVDIKTQRPMAIPEDVVRIYSV